MKRRAERDLDVQLEQLDGWLELVPEADRAALEALRWLLQEERASARVDMLEPLDARRYEILVTQIGRTLRARQPSQPPEAARPALEVVPDVVPDLVEDRFKAFQRRPDASGQMRSPATRMGCASAASAVAARSSWSATSTPGRHVLSSGGSSSVQDLLGPHQDADVAIGRLRQPAARRSDRLKPRPSWRWARSRSATADHDPAPCRSGSRVTDAYLVRHAIAENRDAARWPDDSERPLTPEGIARFRRAARGLRRIATPVDRVLSSPYRRAWQTAEILSHETGWPSPEACPELGAERPPLSLVDVLTGGNERSSLGIVGHEPYLSSLASLLLTGDEDAVSIELKKGGVVLLACPGGLRPGGALLRWGMTPKTLRAIAADH